MVEREEIINIFGMTIGMERGNRRAVVSPRFVEIVEKESLVL